MISKLPYWVLTDKTPAFYDSESKTTIEMTAKVYAKMQELVDDYNKFIDDINKHIEDYETGVNQDLECFKTNITKTCHDYISMMDSKITSQDKIIDEAVKYMKDNLIKTIKELNQTGELNEEIFIAISGVESELINMQNAFEKQTTTRQTNYESTMSTRQSNYESTMTTRQNGYEKEVDDKIRGLASGGPLVANSTADMTDTTRTYVNPTDGNWYYHNGTDWVVGGVYQASEDSTTLGELEEEVNATVTQLLDRSTMQDGFYSAGTLQSDIRYVNFTVPFEPNTTYYLNQKLTGLTISMFLADGTYNRAVETQDGVFTTPNITGLATMSIPIRKTDIFTTILSKTPVPINCPYVNFGETVNVNKTMDNADDSFYKKVDNHLIESYGAVLTDGISYEKRYLPHAVTFNHGNHPNTDIVTWFALAFKTCQANVLINSGILFAENNDYLVGFFVEKSTYVSDNTFNIYRLSKTDNKSTILGTGTVNTVDELTEKKLNCYIKNKVLTIKDYYTDTLYVELNISSYIDDSYQILLGALCQNSEHVNYKRRPLITIYDDTEFEHYDYDYEIKQQINDLAVGNPSLNHWRNRKWYAYGTSLTNINNEGKYPNHLKNLSGLLLTNKGISGGGIVNSNGNIKSAVMNTTDGKLEADLITLEIGANDGTAPLGTVYDTGDDTFAGALNQCIRYLQQNTSAQIVVMSSTSGRRSAYDSSDVYTHDRTFGSDNHTTLDRNNMIEQVCKLNGVYYIPLCEESGLGLSRMSNAYISDQVHHTELGAYNLAQFIWSRLKNIPLWYTQIPE